MASQLKLAVKNTLKIAIIIVIVVFAGLVAFKESVEQIKYFNKVDSLTNKVAGIETKLNQPTATPEATIVPTKALLKSFKAVK